MFVLSRQILCFWFCLSVISFGFSNYALSQPEPLKIALHIEQGEVFVFGVATGWLEIQNTSDEQITIYNGFFETVKPWNCVIFLNGKEKDVGHWISAYRTPRKMVVEPKGMVRKPICLLSDQNGFIFDKVGIGGVQIQTEATFKRSGEGIEKQVLLSNTCQFSIVDGREGMASFKAYFAGYSLGFIGCFPKLVEEKYEEIFGDYSVPYLHIVSYGKNISMLGSFVTTKGTAWKGKKEGVGFNDITQEMVVFCNNSGVGGWLWREVDRVATNFFEAGSDDVFVSNCQIGTVFLAY